LGLLLNLQHRLLFLVGFQLFPFLLSELDRIQNLLPYLIFHNRQDEQFLLDLVFCSLAKQNTLDTDSLLGLQPKLLQCSLAEYKFGFRTILSYKVDNRGATGV